MNSAIDLPQPLDVIAVGAHPDDAEIACGGTFAKLMGNELTVDKDIMVLVNPVIANLPAWVIALAVAGGLAAGYGTNSTWKWTWHDP